MKEKLIERNNTQFQIEILEKEIEKAESQLSNTNKAKKDFYESVLKSFRAQLSILKTRK